MYWACRVQVFLATMGVRSDGVPGLGDTLLAPPLEAIF